MFDIGFPELMLIGVVALVVIGPERLPKVARTAGLLFGRARRYVSDIKIEIEKEIKLEEVRGFQEKMKQSAVDAKHMIIEEVQKTSEPVKDAAAEASDAITEISRGIRQPPAPGASVKTDTVAETPLSPSLPSDNHTE
ncbi:MAG TPA: twin-arginine translocase subunit TatB [Betaproteobacteria bacterium]|nr:twin-arginine translocase subunit TatB [Betaproteobacteria bacterium]